jgi:hypothetical protein
MRKRREKPESEAIRSELRSVSNEAKARILASFFKTGPGEYGEGDLFPEEITIYEKSLGIDPAHAKLPPCKFAGAQRGGPHQPVSSFCRRSD